MYSTSQLSQSQHPWFPEPLETIQPVAFSAPNWDNNHISYDDHSSLFALQRQRREASDASIEALDLADYSRALQICQNDGFLEPFADLSHFRPLDSYSNNDTLEPPSHLMGTRHFPGHIVLFLFRRIHDLLEPGLASLTSIYQNLECDPKIPKSISPTFQYGPEIDHILILDKYIPDLDALTSDQYGFAPAPSLGHDSTRDFLPWGSDPPDAAPIHSSLKEERMRMLEREFGPDAKGKGRTESDDGQILDEKGKLLIGTVNIKEYLVTQGPKKRAALRALQILLSFAAAGPSIYAALFIKPTETPPPAGKAPAFVLYLLSVLTLLLLLDMFVFRPSCCMGRRSKGVKTSLNRMTVVPGQGLPGWEKRKNKQEQKGRILDGGDIQVNLIVDPEAFGNREKENNEEEDNEDWNEGMPADYSTVSNRSRKARRRNVFAGLAMEENRKMARLWTKKVTFVNVVLLFAWGSEFIFVMIGKRCPSGKFNGWCNAYNVSSAACLLSVAFGVSIFSNVKDLNDSKVSPRTRV